MPRSSTDVALVRRSEPAGRAAIYNSPRVGDNDRHLVGRHRDAVANVDGAGGNTPWLGAAADSGHGLAAAAVLA